MLTTPSQRTDSNSHNHKRQHQRFTGWRSDDHVTLDIMTHLWALARQAQHSGARKTEAVGGPTQTHSLTDQSMYAVNGRLRSSVHHATTRSLVFQPSRCRTRLDDPTCRGSLVFLSSLHPTSLVQHLHTQGDPQYLSGETSSGVQAVRRTDEVPRIRFVSVPQRAVHVPLATRRQEITFQRVQ